jgi:hypothetical protein
MVCPHATYILSLTVRVPPTDNAVISREPILD